MKVEGHAGWTYEPYRAELWIGAPAVGRAVLDLIETCTTYEGLIVAMADRLLEPELEQLDLFGGAA